jgi:ATP-dependent Lon protease
LLELEPLPNGTLKVLAQVHRRVMIRRFAEETGAFQAEVAELSEGPIPDLPELIQIAVKRFESYAAAHDIRIPQVWPQLDQTRDPGRVADIIAARIKLPIPDKQGLLATLDPETRLRRVDALLDLSARPLSTAFEATQRRALDYANQRSQGYATLEHLLLALTDDADASAVMKACGADLSALKASLLGYLDNELKHIVIENGGEAKPTAAFQRASQRAALHAQELGRAAVTGADLLLGLFPETQSPAARFLGQHGVSRARAADLVARAGQ